MEGLLLIALAFIIYCVLREERKKEIERIEIHRMNMEKIIFNRLERLENDEKVCK